MAGCDAYLTKPVDPARLHQVLMPFITDAGTVLATASAHTPLQRLA
jgi:CheY-like chemotaxis protein